MTDLANETENLSLGGSELNDGLGDENYVRLNKADLYDFLRGEIKELVDIYADDGQANNWSTASILTYEILTKLYKDYPPNVLNQPLRSSRLD